MNDEPDTKWNVQVKFLNEKPRDKKDEALTRIVPLPKQQSEGQSRTVEPLKVAPQSKQPTPISMSESSPSYGKPPLGPRTWPSWIGTGLLTLISFTPMSAKRALASVLTWLYVDKIGRSSRHVRTVNINLTACYPDANEAEKRQLLKDYFFTLMLGVFQMPQYWWRKQEFVVNNAKRIGLQPVIDAQENGNACVFLITHTICLDAGLVALSPDFDMTGFYKPFKNPLVDWLTRRARSRFGGKPIARGDGFREIIRRMKDQAILCYLCDEDYGPEASVFAPFFGHEKATLKMLPKITKLTKAKIFPMATYLNKTTGEYEIHIQPALENYPSGDETQDAAILNTAIERSIRTDPTQYLWKLQLFRSCPHGKDSRYLQVARGELAAENL